MTLQTWSLRKSPDKIAILGVVIVGYSTDRKIRAKCRSQPDEVPDKDPSECETREMMWHCDNHLNLSPIPNGDKVQDISDALDVIWHADPPAELLLQAYRDTLYIILYEINHNLYQIRHLTSSNPPSWSYCLILLLPQMRLRRMRTSLNGWKSRFETAIPCPFSKPPSPGSQFCLYYDPATKG